MERDVVQHRAAAIVAEADAREINVAANILHHLGSLRLLILRTLPQNLTRALKASESLSKLSANRDHLHNWRNQEAQEQRVSKESANGQRAGHDLAGADIHDHRANYSEQQAGGKTHYRSRRKRAHNVVEQPAHSRGEHRLFTFFGVVALDHAHAAERCCQPSGYLGVDFAALAKNWADRSKSFLQREAEAKQESEGNHSHYGADAKQHHHRDASRNEAADKLHNPRPQPVAHAFHVADNPVHKR